MLSLKPLSIYKFLPSKYVDDFLSKGTLKLGTAEEYRKPDGKTGARQDANEFTNRFAPIPGTYRLDKSHPLAVAFPGLELADIQVSEGSAIKSQSNGLMYCTSLDISEGMRKRMSRDFGADTCVKISDRELFGHLLHGHRELKKRNGHWRDVSYLDKSKLRDHTNDAPFQKDLQFGWQREFRFLWYPYEGETLESKIIDVPEITSMLKRIY